MKYAEVAVNAPGGHRNSFSYSIPSFWDVRVGDAVWVPFGSKILQGIVIELSSIPQVPVTKQVIDLISPRTSISPERIKLALWIAEYYLAPLFNAVALFLPPGFERSSASHIQWTGSDTDSLKLDKDLKAFVQAIQDSGGELPQKALEAKFGIKRSASMLRELLNKKLVTKTALLERERVKPKFIDYLKLNFELEQTGDIVTRLKEKGAHKQAAIIDLLVRNGGCLPLPRIGDHIVDAGNTVKVLVRKGMVERRSMEVKRDPLAKYDFALEFPFTFTPDQQEGWDIIKAAMEKRSGNNKPGVFVLYGVTGSGKTEIYLRALSEMIKRGKKGICLVPEISLTSQTIERFYARFPGRVAVMHSKLTLGEQYDEWARIHEGDFDVVIGARSAIFTPQPDLGLIIIDEEHEWAYKQTEKSPRYHARNVAIKLADLTGAMVILGSATPDVETYYRSQKSEFKLIELKERVTPAGISPLPEVNIINLREEYKAGTRGLFSRTLKEQIDITLHKQQQIILYVNRRGSATLVKCGNCGYIPGCKRCDVVLTYHSAMDRLICHHCRKTYAPIKMCPQCLSKEIRYFGVGTETVEEECRRLFPKANIIRFDSEVASGMKEYASIVSSFRRHQADILIGTQIVAKGLDFPGVTLVGVINADIGLNLPDFRSSERTFQLLCQVSGRAGRGILPGRSIIQTFNPEHYAIKYAAGHDYTGFYENEMKYRRNFGYPPLTAMVRLVFTHTNMDKCRTETGKMVNIIGARRERQGAGELKIIGPSPTFHMRLRGKYQMQIILLGHDISTVLKDMAFPAGWVLDVDPVGVV
ncbi:MAG: primosomal protein N' [Dehalococcoidia bacterium]|nr:primosomal protein N' [Dehalococcoidia bacterium]MDD5494788.1 primosomal protein N' [Dehalococcoidia bacterium]